MLRRNYLLALFLLSTLLFLAACGENGGTIQASELETAGVLTSLNGRAVGEIFTIFSYRQPFPNAQPLPEDYALNKPYYIVEYDRHEPYEFYGGHGKYQMTSAKAYGIDSKDSNYLESGTMVFVFYDYGAPKTYKSENGAECIGVRQDATVYFQEIGSEIVYQGSDFDGAVLKQEYKKTVPKDFINKVNRKEILTYIQRLSK